jgi:hypothetical protein
MNNKARLSKLEESNQKQSSTLNNWVVNIIDSNGEVVDRYYYPSKEKVANEH